MRKPAQYFLREAFSRDGTTYEKGLTVYDCIGYDYGLSSDDTRMTGVEHVSVTLNRDGDYPCFTIPQHTLERIEQ